MSVQQVVGTFEVRKVFKGWKDQSPKWVRLYAHIPPFEAGDTPWAKGKEVVNFADFEKAKVWNNGQKTGVPDEKVILRPWMCGMPTLPEEVEEYFQTHPDESKKP